MNDVDERAECQQCQRWQELYLSACRSRRTLAVLLLINSVVLVAVCVWSMLKK